MKKHIYVVTIKDVCNMLENDIKSFGKCTVSEYIRDKEHEERVNKIHIECMAKQKEELILAIAQKSQILDECAMQIDILNERLMRFIKYGADEASSLENCRKKLIKLYQKEVEEQFNKKNLESKLEELIDETN